MVYIHVQGLTIKRHRNGKNVILSLRIILITHSGKSKLLFRFIFRWKQNYKEKEEIITAASMIKNSEVLQYFKSNDENSMFFKDTLHTPNVINIINLKIIYNLIYYNDKTETEKMNVKKEENDDVKHEDTDIMSAIDEKSLNSHEYSDEYRHLTIEKYGSNQKEMDKYIDDINETTKDDVYSDYEDWDGVMRIVAETVDNDQITEGVEWKKVSNSKEINRECDEIHSDSSDYGDWDGITWRKDTEIEQKIDDDSDISDYEDWEGVYWRKNFKN
jgi:hypothetical protein